MVGIRPLVVKEKVLHGNAVRARLAKVVYGVGVRRNEVLLVYRLPGVRRGLPYGVVQHVDDGLHGIVVGLERPVDVAAFLQ